MAKLLEVPEEKLAPLYDEDLTALDQGKLSGEEFYRRMIEGLGLDVNPRDLMKLVETSYSRKNEVIEFLQELKNKYEVALLTNFGDYFDECDKDWQIAKLFDEDKVFVSCRIGKSKPNRDIYEYVLEKLEREASETVFIDDNALNVEGAKAIGINAIRFVTLEQTKNELQSIIEAEKVHA
jgi:putative hydrolase of the HAD superfamily